MTTHEMALRRSILLSARVRFSPSGATVRNQAIEKIIEQTLASADETEGLAESELQEFVTLGGKIPVLRIAEVRQGLNCLQRGGRVVQVKSGKSTQYRLTEAAKSEVVQSITGAEEQTRATLEELFGTAPGGANAYRTAFIKLLCLVFSRLSEIYVHVITRTRRMEDLLENHLLGKSLDDTLKAEHVPDEKAFRYGVTRFLRESTPRFDAIKWNMAQNFYVAKALGIDSASDLLSSEIFKDGTLYCDTNVLIAGLTPESRHHGSFKELANACNSINMSLAATHPTLQELKAVIGSHSQLLQKLIDKIPDATRQKVRNFLLEAYLAQQGQTHDLPVEDFVKRFESPLETLQLSFGVTEIDDGWFDEAEFESATNALANSIAKTYESMRGRPKKSRPATHDALLVRWTARENENGRKSWAVTLDTTLTEWNAREKGNGFNLITLDAFLQWMTPVTSGSADEDSLAGIYADALKYQLLPQETFFRLSDFQIFEDMGIESRQLPAEDVEACISAVKHSGPHLDPSKAEDRERIGKILQQYFSDVGTKFKETVQELETRSETLAEKLHEQTDLLSAAEKQVQDLAEKNKEMAATLSNTTTALAEANSRIERLEQSQRERDTARKHKRLVISTVLRSLVMALIFVTVEVLAGFLILKYGSGTSPYDKLTTGSFWFTPGALAVTIAYPFVLGRERRRLLKWWQGQDD